MKQLIKRMRMLGYEIEVKSDRRFKCFDNEDKKEFVEIIKSDGFFILQVCNGMTIENVWFRNDEQEMYNLLVELENMEVI